MNIADYILKEVKPLSLQNTVNDALLLCNDFPISHVLIVEKNRLLGCFSESDIRTIEDTNQKLSKLSYLFTHFYTDEKETPLDVLQLFANNDCNLIPVLNKHQNYIGYYELADVLDLFTNSPFLQNESDTLILEKTKTAFSMSEVSQIIEANNGKLLGLYISLETADKIQITLKVISQEINEVIQTFRRYHYTVITKHEDDHYLEELKNRSEYLQKYLNI